MSVQKNTPNFLKHSGLSFTTIINQTMDRIKDDGALGIYCYLASKPENWEICQTHLQNRFGKGREYIQKRIKMLKDSGLIKIEPIRNELGKILHWETSLVNFVETQNTENPYCGELSTETQNTGLSTSRKSQNLGKQALVIKDKKQIKDKSFCTSQNLEKISQNQKRSAQKLENEKKHSWAPMKNESSHIKQHATRKKMKIPPEFTNMIDKIKQKMLVT